MIKLTAFRIQDFRSIKDSKWRNLSSDNITCLIGQNESGKTSILDGLYCFHTGTILHDDLRSDGAFPAISCSFEIGFSKLKELLLNELPADFPWSGFQSIYTGRVNLLRRWISVKENILNLEEEHLISFIDSQTNSIKKSDAEVNNSEDSDNSSAQYFAEKVFSVAPKFSVFEDFSSLMPDNIDIKDLYDEKSGAEGFNGAWNIFEITDVEPQDLIEKDNRMREIAIDRHNTSININFQEFWQQKIGDANKIEIEFDLKNHDSSIPSKAGEPYVEFWVKDGLEKLYPKQRSKGVRWFISFYLQLKADKKNNDANGSILLIDEPGGSLHAKAQEDLLKVLEDIKDTVQVIYTTHSPHLVKLSTLYRILAIQRSIVNDNNDTEIIDINNLGSASVDTLLPIYNVMGVDASFQEVIKKTGNIILEEISAYYYFKAFWKLFSKSMDNIALRFRIGGTDNGCDESLLARPS